MGNYVCEVSSCSRMATVEDACGECGAEERCDEHRCLCRDLDALAVPCATCSPAHERRSHLDDGECGTYAGACDEPGCECGRFTPDAVAA